MNQHRKANAFPDRRVPGDPRLLDAIQRRTPNLSGGSVTHVFGSTILIPERQRRVASTSKGPCYFGEIIKYSETIGSDEEPTEKTGIRGGWLKAGKKNWRVENREINLAADGVFPIWIRVAITANTDRDGIATLAGLKTSEEPVWEHGSGSDDYPDSEIPEQFPLSDPGAGVAIIPIGILTVADGAASIVAIGCGNIILTYCPGNLDHIRGPIGTGSGSGSDA